MWCDVTRCEYEYVSTYSEVITIASLNLTFRSRGLVCLVWSGLVWSAVPFQARSPLVLALGSFSPSPSHFLHCARFFDDVRVHIYEGIIIPTVSEDVCCYTASWSKGVENEWNIRATTTTPQHIRGILPSQSSSAIERLRGGKESIDEKPNEGRADEE